MAWKMIEGYKHPYRISDMGEVQSYYNGAWRTMKPQMGGWRRACIQLMRKDNTRSNVPIVRLMANAFMGGTREGCCIIHKNGDRLDNSVYNLKFETRRNACALSNGAKRRPVIKIDSDGNEVEVYPSAKAAAKANFISQSAVTAHCRGEMKNPFLRCEWDFKYEDTAGYSEPKRGRRKKHGKR